MDPLQFLDHDPGAADQALEPSDLRGRNAPGQNGVRRRSRTRLMRRGICRFDHPVHQRCRQGNAETATFDARTAPGGAAYPRERLPDRQGVTKNPACLLAFQIEGPIAAPQGRKADPETLSARPELEKGRVTVFVETQTSRDIVADPHDHLISRPFTPTVIVDVDAHRDATDRFLPRFAAHPTRPRRSGR
ncbi:MAG: hypothetical protein KDH19_01285 [Geminicoccaceae bacterium]|nr:hypothetical protein [Geminicoccaceae bacterium]